MEKFLLCLDRNFWTRFTGRTSVRNTHHSQCLISPEIRPHQHNCLIAFGSSYPGRGYPRRRFRLIRRNLRGNNKSNGSPKKAVREVKLVEGCGGSSVCLCDIRLVLFAHVRF